MQPSTQFTNPNDALRKFSNVDVNLVKQIAVAASVGGSRGRVGERVREGAVLEGGGRGSCLKLLQGVNAWLS